MIAYPMGGVKKLASLCRFENRFSSPAQEQKEAAGEGDGDHDAAEDGEGDEAGEFRADESTGGKSGQRFLSLSCVGTNHTVAANSLFCYTGHWVRPMSNKEILLTD